MPPKDKPTAEEEPPDALQRPQEPETSLPPGPTSQEIVAREGSTIRDVRQVAGDLVEGDKVMGDKVMGDQYVIQVTPPISVEASPAGLSQAPRPLAEFVGREREIGRLVQALKPGAKAAITGVVGMGGLGKTELAKVVAHRLAEGFRDGVLWADCGRQELTPSPTCGRLLTACRLPATTCQPKLLPGAASSAAKRPYWSSTTFSQDRTSECSFHRTAGALFW